MRILDRLILNQGITNNLNPLNPGNMRKIFLRRDREQQKNNELTPTHKVEIPFDVDRPFFQ